MDSPHFNLATHPVKDTIKLLTTLLEKITQRNDQLYPEKRQYTCFHARSIPSIAIYAYFTRILKYCPCANECLIAILVYFDRMTQPDPKLGLKPLHVDSYNVHRLIITGLMISSKLYSDVFFTNTRYAKVGGLPVAELNSLELEFLRLNNYNLFVDIDVLQSYGDDLLDLWNQSQDLESLLVREAARSEEANSGGIERSFNQLSMKDCNSNESSTPNTPTEPAALADDHMDKQWRYNSRSNYGLNHHSGNG
ncbi:cyclin-domain-containing protein [Parasitella parasitica]|nr:cyclin-domain-containing protein [Parasitella parasitica]